MQKLLSKLTALCIATLLSLPVFAQIVNPNPPGATNWTAPGTIGSATPNTGQFTTLSANNTASFTGNTFTFNPGTPSKTSFQIGTGSTTSAGLYMGYEGSSGYGAIWSTGVTPSTSNFVIDTNGSQSYFNGVNNAIISVGGTNVATASSTAFSMNGSMLFEQINGTAAAPSDVFTGATTTGTYWANPGIGFSVAGVSYGTLTSAGFNATTFNGALNGNATTATSATTATNLAGGAADSIPYQTATGTTGFIAAGTNGYVMQMVAGVPAWANSSGVFNPAAVAITGGTINGTTIGATTPSTVSSTGGALNGTIGATTASSGAFTGVTSTSGYAGVSNGTNLCATCLGVSSSNNTNSLSLTNGTPVACTSISVPAGVWLIWGQALFQGAASTTTTDVAANISILSATIPVSSLNYQIQGATFTNANLSGAIPMQIASVTTATTYYLNAVAAFSVSTMTMGCQIEYARIG